MSHSVVVGGAGFVGSWVVEEILKDPEAKVTIIDNLISSEKWNISTDKRVTFVKGSASEISTFNEITREVDFVFQLACFHGNQSSIARPLDDLENGLKSTLVTLEWVNNVCPQTKVIYAGAGCATANKTWETPSPVEESNSTELLHDSPYSISKIVGEMYCLYYAEQNNLDVVRVRFQNVYGPREILGAGKWRGTEHTIWRNVIPTFIYKAINNMDLHVFGPNASRDFVYVQDVAEGIILAARKGLAGEVYNIASGIETNIHELSELIIAITNSKSKVITTEKRKWDNSGRRLGSTTKSRENLGFEAHTSLNQGLTETIEWTKRNIIQIKSSMAKHVTQL